MSTVTENIISLNNTKIFIAGDIIFDIYIEGNVNKISKDAPVPVLNEKNRRYMAGGASNVAENITAIGANAFLCGRIGNDSDGQILKNVLIKCNIKTNYLLVSDTLPTTTKTRLVSVENMGVHQLIRFDKVTSENISEEEENKVIEFYQDFINIGGNRALIISDYCHGFLTKNLISSLIKISNQHQIPIVTDPICQDIWRYKGSTVIKPNISEVRSFFYLEKTDFTPTSFLNEIETISDYYLKRSECENIVMSLSENGVMCKGNMIDGVLKYKSTAINVCDVTGAGDTQVAFIAMSLAIGINLSRSVEIGNIAAGIVCGKLGTASVSLNEFMEDIRKQNQSLVKKEKIVTLETLVKITNELKSQNKKIIFTNGCYDVIHVGHIALLEKAKSRGDIFIVAINSDSSIARLNGPKRPINPEEDRAAVLASLTCVDYIVIFPEDNASVVINKIQPNIYVKGCGYTLENALKTEGKNVASWGGTIELYSIKPEKSCSSFIIESAELTKKNGIIKK